jgi:hypothetical protein
MDANGNKVHALRQQFENYEKLEPSYTTVGKYSSPLKGTSSGLMGRSVEFRPLSITKNVMDVSATGYLLTGNSSSTSSNTTEDTRRNGIYVSNSITLHHDLTPSKSQPDLSSSHKRRPVVLDLNQCGNVDMNYMDDDHSSLLLLGRGGGDELSITSSSSSTCVNLLNTSNSSTNNEGEHKDSESQAHTPTSSSSASSGSGYGKVKRSNAFRAKDMVPTNTVTETRFVNKSKLVLERVKSLDATSGSHNDREDPSKGQDSGGHSSSSKLGISGGGSPAQRAASLCVRSSTTSHPKASQIFDTKSRQGSTSSSSGAAHTTTTTGGKAVNIVIPYQVSDIYSQIRSGTTGSQNHHHHNHQNQGSRKMSQEAEYAVPMVRTQRSTSNGNNSHILGIAVSPPKVPPPPLNYPPSTVKDQIGLPGPDSTYSYLQQRRHSQYDSDETFSVLPKGHVNQKDLSNKQKRSVVVLGTANPTSNQIHDPQPSAGHHPISQAPPEKPPRTFLYDILTDRQTQSQQQKKFGQTGGTGMSKEVTESNKNNNNELYAETPKKPSPQKVSDHNNVSTSQTGVSASNPKRQYSSSSSSSTLTSSTTSYQQPLSGRGNIAVSTATVRQTNKSSNGNFLGKNVFNSNSALLKGNNNNNNNKTSSIPSCAANDKSSNNAKSKNANNVDGNTNINNVIYAGNPHPPLVRSKTESQLIVKNKSSWTHHQHRPSLIGGGIDDSNKNNSSNYDYGYLTNGNGSNPSGSALNYYVSSSPHHRQSQNNLLNNHKLYEALPQSRSTNNLLKYNNRYPSNPGIYQAVSSSWKDYDDHGLPRTNGSNLRYTNHVHPSNHNHTFHGSTTTNTSANQDHRSNSCMYITDIDLEMDMAMAKGLNSLRVRDKSDGNGLSVFVNNNNSNAGNMNNRCASDDRLCERSKSEWTLNQVQSGSGSVAPSNNISSSGILYGESGSSNNSSSGNGTNGNRRNTIVVANLNASGGVGGNSTGHPSLESTSSSSISSSQNQLGLGQHHGMGSISQKKPGIQQSVS